MAASPRYKVYDAITDYQGSCKEKEAAIALAEYYGTGATVRDGHSKIIHQVLPIMGRSYVRPTDSRATASP